MEEAGKVGRTNRYRKRTKVYHEYWVKVEAFLDEGRKDRGVKRQEYYKKITSERRSENKYTWAKVHRAGLLGQA